MAYRLAPIDEEVEVVGGEEPEPETQAIPDETTPAASESAPSVAEAPPPKTAPVHEAPDIEIPEVDEIPKVTFAADKPKPLRLKPVDEEVEVVEASAPVKPKEKDSWGDPKDYPIIRGAVEGLKTLQGGAQIATVLDLSFGGKSDEEKLNTILAKDPEQAASEWERREPSFTTIESAGEAWNYALESLGSATTSTLPSVVGGAVGAAFGSAAGPVGTAVGAFAGAAGPSWVLGVSGMYDELRGNEGVRKALENGTITPDQLLKLTYIGGTLSGALDAFPASKFGKGLGVQAAKDYVRDTIVKAAIRGAFEEGGTEGLQQVISEITQSQGGGDTSFKQQAINVMDAMLQGAIGGAVFGAGTRPKLADEEVEDAGITDNADETEEKTDDQSDRSNETQPEGTPATVEAGDAAGTPTPGSTSADTPSPPAGTDKQPAPPVDPTVPAEPQPEPKAQPAPKAAGGVTVITPGKTDPAITEALGGEPEEDVGDIEAELAAEEEGTEEALAAHTARIQDLFRREDERTAELAKAREKKAGATRVAAAGEAEAAALAAPPTITSGTPSAALQQGGLDAIVQNAIAKSQAAAKPVTTENLGTGQALAAPEPDIMPEPAADAVATAEEATDQGAVARPAPLPEQAPTLVPAEPAPEPEVQPEPELEAAPDIEPLPELRLIPVTEEVEVVEPAVAAFKPAAPAPQQRQPGKLTLKSRQAAPVALKGELYKRRKAAEAPGAQPEAQRAPAAAPEPAAATKTRAGRDAATLAKDSPELRHSTVSETEEFDATVEAVAEEVVARRRKEEPGRPTLELIKDSVKEIADTVKQRLARQHAAVDAEKERIARKAEVGYKVVEAEEAEASRKQEMATTKVGQKKERAKKEGGKSAAGLRNESEEATYRAYQKELKKKPEEREAALLKWGQLHERQTKLPATGIIKEGEHKGKPAKQVREQLKAEKAAIHEERATAQEAKDVKPAGLSERAQSVEGKLKKALADLPSAVLSGSGRAQTAQINAHLKQFLAAIEGIPVADHVDRTHQSIWENLAIFAKKLRSKSQDTQGQGPLEFWMAHRYAETDSEQIYDLITNEKIQGAEYKEEVGEDKTVAAAYHEDETSLRRRIIEQDTGEYGTLEKEQGEQSNIELKRGQVPAEQGTEDFRPIEVTLPKNPDGSGGGKATVRAETSKASKVLKDVKKMESPGGFLGILRTAHIRHLSKLVGDVDVHFISGADMKKLSGKDNATGLYFNYTNAERAAGHKPMVFLLNSLHGHPDLLAHNALHELTHAATSYAIRNNINGTFKILERMMKSLNAQLVSEFGPGWKSQVGAEHLKYGFTNPAEFAAEAFSNPDFQKLLKKMVVPADIRRDINALGKGRVPTWWDAFTAAVSNAIHMVSGQRGQTYMEQIIALDPHLTMTSAEQKTDADVRGLGPRRPPPGFEDMFGNAQPMLRQAQDQFDAVKEWATDKTYGRRRLRDIFATTGEHIRRAQEHGNKAFGEALERLGRAHLRRDPMRAKLRKSAGFVKPDGKGGWKSAKEGEAGAEKIDNEAIELATLELRKNEPEMYARAGRWLSDASRFKVNGSVALSHADNKHISKGGGRGADQRAFHADSAKEFAGLSPAAQKLIKAHIKHYRQTFELENDAKIRHSLRSVLKGYHKQLPKGKTIDDAIDWVRSGGASRAVEDRTPEDKVWHDALGNTAKTLGSIPDLRKIPGVYAPMLRKGRLFITVKERPFGTIQNPKNVPKGAILDALTKKDEDAPNRLLFANRKDYDAFVDSFPGQVSFGTKWVHEKTGLPVDDAGHKISSKDVNARRVIVATVQNNRMEMSDSRKQLAARSAELRAQGHRVDAIRTSKKHLHHAVEEISPPQVKALLRNLEQTTIGQNTAGQQLVKGAVLDAQVRMMNSPGRLERHLKRRNILGNETDLLDMMTDYNGTLASGLTHYELGHELAEADQAVEDAIKTAASREMDDGKINAMQQQASEIRHRIADTQYVHGPKILQVAKDITFLRHLASPHYTMIQLTQPFMMTYPILSAKYGRAAAWQAMMEIYFMGGVRQSLGRGFHESWNAGKRLFGKGSARGSVSHDEFWKDYADGQPDAAGLKAVVDAVVELGYGASSGIEASAISEADMSFGRRKLSQMVDVARALPESAESVNRYTTAFATYRLAKRAGKSEAEAIREAVLTVEETQGGYGAANNPAFFNNPYLAPATQFRKFALAYGQVYYRNLAYSFNGATPEQKKLARKSLARLSLMTIATAGVWGLAPVEVARTLVNAAAMMGFKEDDWEEDENQIQEWVGEFMGEGLSEALFRGAPRLANLDLSGSLGVDNLAMFGQPEEMSSEGIYEWLAKAAVGAPGGVLAKALDSYQKGNFLEEGLPIPKVFKNLLDARKLAFTGTVDPKTGEQYMEPVGVIEAVYKALGFRTASEAREWETGGGGYENEEEREERAERRTLMGRWSNLSPGDRMEFFNSEIRRWNANHKGDPDMQITHARLMQSKKKREKDRREREKERQ